MSINSHQFEQLTEMGISLWQRKSVDNSNTAEENTDATTHKYDEIDLHALSKLQFFNDILLCSGLSIGEVTQQGDHLDLGLFNWFFDVEQSDIRWTEQQLFTPSMDKVSKSPQLKKQLWQVLSSNTQ